MPRALFRYVRPLPQQGGAGGSVTRAPDELFAMLGAKNVRPGSLLL